MVCARVIRQAGLIHPNVISWGRGHWQERGWTSRPKSTVRYHFASMRKKVNLTSAPISVIMTWKGQGSEHALVHHHYLSSIDSIQKKVSKREGSMRRDHWTLYGLTGCLELWQVCLTSSTFIQYTIRRANEGECDDRWSDRHGGINETLFSAYFIQGNIILSKWQW